MNAGEKLLSFVREMSRLVSERGVGEPVLREETDRLLRTLISEDDWLPEELAAPHPKFYQQHLLYGDPRDRFCVVSFVWGPGQQTPIHDHTVWGVIGMLRGAECGQAYAPSENGGPLRACGHEERLEPGMTAQVSPTIGDVHRVRNAYGDRVSISIHVYGGNIGRIRRHVFDEATGAVKEFVSGYSNTLTPNLWKLQ